MRATVLGCIVTLCSVGAAQASAVADCNQVRDPQLRLRACSQIIARSGYAINEEALAYRNRANARSDAGANTEALADFNEAVNLRPDDSTSYAGRARVRLALRDFDGATADFSEALRLDPGTVSSHIGLGHAHFVRGDTTAAIADFTEAIRPNPQSAQRVQSSWAGLPQVICPMRSTTTPLPLPSTPSTPSPITTAAMSTKGKEAKMRPSRTSNQHFSSIHR